MKPKKSKRVKIKKAEESEDEETENNATSPFSQKKHLIVLLKAICTHGYPDLPFDIILPDMSEEEQDAEILSLFKRVEKAVKDRPSMVNWLRSKLFEDDYKVPLALLFIELYEDHSISDQGKTECNFREIYHFLYKITMNQPLPRLSQNSAKILHKLLSEVIEEVWPRTQQQLVNYLTKVQSYNRTGIRKMYSRKRKRNDGENEKKKQTEELVPLQRKY